MNDVTRPFLNRFYNKFTKNPERKQLISLYEDLFSTINDIVIFNYVAREKWNLFFKAEKLRKKRTKN